MTLNQIDSLYSLYVLLQNEARKLNHAAVVEEDRVKKLPANWEAKRKRLEWEEAEEQRRKVPYVMLLIV